MILTSQPAEAGEAKRKSLSAIRAILSPIRTIATAVYLATEIIDEGLQRAIQRDLDQEENIKAAIEAQEEEESKPEPEPQNTEIQPGGDNS